jgi:hypothetical protein
MNMNEIISIHFYLFLILIFFASMGVSLLVTLLYLRLK